MDIRFLISLSSSLFVAIAGFVLLFADKPYNGNTMFNAAWFLALAFYLKLCAIEAKD